MRPKLGRPAPRSCDCETMADLADGVSVPRPASLSRGELYRTCMDAGAYADIRGIVNFPSFHDAELTCIEHDPGTRTLELRFRRAGGEIEVLRFSGVIGQRMIDFAGQNVASRLLISSRYVFSSAEVRTWLQWINSRDDSKGAAISEKEGDEYVQKLKARDRVLFVLEPSCGAEMAVLCESLSLKV
jgi:hypothetical protein